ncbi:hypothetical protein C9374_001890 [Naegleria lovaniensis]|uniref:Uncharacterized protein n=1 Tax=Naegleria lovaniensis TaxID=51637 RepID=A0AA88GQ43_NAELO|nr:uncharacterized protein C9374_001890 [Naegleria lovaniensis]KAG2386855.1 hypothetical protein C9374_001890 [Naegleria lovaniensis]
MIPSQPFECNSKNPFPPSSILSSTSAKPPILSSFPGFIHVPYFPTTNNNNKSNTKNITETLFHEDLTIRCSTTPNVERSSSSDTITTTRPRSNNNYFRNDSNINETKENHVSSESSDESSSSSGHGDSHTEMNQSNNSEPLITPVKTKRRRKKKKGLYCYQSYLDCQRKEKKLRTITENEEQSLLHDLNLIFYPNHSHHDEIMNFPKYPKVNYAQKLVNTTELARIRAKLVFKSELVPANNNTTTSTTNTHQPETISIYPQTLSKSKIIPKILPKPLMQSKTASMTSPFTIPQRNRIQNIIGNNKTSTSSYPQGSKIPTNAFPFMPIPSMFQFSSQPSLLTSLARSHHSSPSHYYAFTQPPRPLPSHYVVVESQHSYDSTTSQNKEPSTMMATGERMMMHSNITEEEIQSADLTNYKVNIAVRADIDITTVADHIDHIPSKKIP